MLLIPTPERFGPQPTDFTFDCPNPAQLAALGFREDLSFGIEIEMFATTGRQSTADILSNATGLTVSPQSYNHNRVHVWKLTNDSSLGHSEPRYDCTNCDETRQCNGDCSTNGTDPHYNCDDCDFADDCENAGAPPTEYDSTCHAETSSNYDCDECTVTPTCDNDCPSHVDAVSPAGLELVTPPLYGAQGISELWRMTKAIRDNLTTSLNDAAGLHVHIGASHLTGQHVANVMRLYLKHERNFDSLMLPPRRLNACGCARTLTYPLGHYVDYLDMFRRVQDCQSHAEVVNAWGCDRYLKVNPTALRHHGTIEFRHHHGTTDFNEIFYWLLLCQTMIATAPRVRPQPSQNVGLRHLFRTLHTTPQLNAYYLDRQNFLHLPRRTQTQQSKLRRQYQADYEAAAPTRKRISEREMLLFAAAGHPPLNTTPSPPPPPQALLPLPVLNTITNEYWANRATIVNTTYQHIDTLIAMGAPIPTLVAEPHDQETPHDPLAHLLYAD